LSAGNESVGNLVKRGREVDEYHDLNTSTCSTYTGNGETQTLQFIELIRSDSEQMNGGIENTAGGSFVSVEGIGGQQNEGGT
jgi:hypothetical protein